MAWKIITYFRELINKMNEKQILTKARDIWYRHAMLREGKRNYVYNDSLGKPTCGIGHLVLKCDNLNIGDKVSENRIQAFFEMDSQKAMTLAVSQARELGHFTPEFIAALTSVNFQLGNWSKVFKTSYPLLKQGRFTEVIANLNVSKWAKQTPVRVKDFVEAIEREYG